jgi:hypothetical protein
MWHYPRPRYNFSLGRLLLFLLLATATLAVGYHRRSWWRPPRPVPATGTVTLDGNPLADAQVVFVPVERRDGQVVVRVGRGAIGTTDQTGRFVLIGDGAVPGFYKVAVLSSSLPDNTMERDELIDVKAAGPNAFAIRLVTQKAAAAR